MDTLLNSWALDPNNIAILFQKGEEYYKNNNYAGAVSFLLKCAELHPDPLVQYDCLVSIADIYIKIGGRDYSSETYAYSAIKLNPSRIEAYILLEKVYSNRESWWSYKDERIIDLIFNLGVIEETSTPLKIFKGYTIQDYYEAKFRVLYDAGFLDEAFELLQYIDSYIPYSRVQESYLKEIEYYSDPESIHACIGYEKDNFLQVEKENINKSLVIDSIYSKIRQTCKVQLYSHYAKVRKDTLLDSFKEGFFYILLPYGSNSEVKIGSKTYELNNSKIILVADSTKVISSSLGMIVIEALPNFND